MGQYIHFTEEQKLRAGSVDLEEFLRCHGERLIPSGKEKRLSSDHSITVDGNEWYQMRSTPAGCCFKRHSMEGTMPDMRGDMAEINE